MFISTEHGYKVGWLGNGDEFRIAGYLGLNHAVTFIDNIQSSVGQPELHDLDTGVDNNNWPTGAGLAVYVISTTVPESTTLTDLVSTYSDKFALLSPAVNEVLDAALTNIPPLPNKDGSFSLTTSSLLYQVSKADGTPCTFLADDAIKSQVAEWGQVQKEQAPFIPEWTFTQSIVSSRLQLDYNHTLQRNVLKGSGKSFDMAEPGIINNSSYFEFFIAVNFTSSAHSVAIRLGSNDGDDLILLSNNRCYILSNISSVSYSQLSGAYVYRIQIPKNNSFNGGAARIYRNKTLLGSLPSKTREVLSSGAINTITLTGDAELTGIFFQPEEMDNIHEDNAWKAAADSIGITL